LLEDEKKKRAAMEKEHESTIKQISEKYVAEAAHQASKWTERFDKHKSILNVHMNSTRSWSEKYAESQKEHQHLNRTVETLTELMQQGEFNRTELK